MAISIRRLFRSASSILVDFELLGFAVVTSRRDLREVEVGEQRRFCGGGEGEGERRWRRSLDLDRLLRRDLPM
jgi:hypothetical protein